MADIDVINVGGTDYNIKDATARTAATNAQTAANGKAPTSHAVNAATYGLGTASLYGHVKLSDTYNSSVGAAANSIGASQAALYNAYTALRNAATFPVGTIESTNCNNLVNPGIYYADNGAANRPSTSTAGTEWYVIYVSMVNNFVQQLAMPVWKAQTVRIFYRIREENGTWSEWFVWAPNKVITGTATLNTSYVNNYQSQAGVYYYKTGNVCMANIHVMFQNVTQTEGEYPIASGLPASIWKMEDMIGLIDGTTNHIMPVKIRTDGVLCLHPKQTLPNSGKWYDGSITYACAV